MASKAKQTDLGEAGAKARTDEDADAGAPPGKRKLPIKLIVIAVGALAVVAGGGAGAYFIFGGGHKTQAVAAPIKAPTFLDVPEVLVNLSGTERTQYLKVKVVLELPDAAFSAQVQGAMPRVMDAFQTYLRELRPTDLDGSAGLYRLKEELTRRVNAAISRPANAAILVRLRIDMEDRGGNVELLLPYATIEPIREMLLQMFMGEKFGRDPIWEGHLATEIGQAEIAVDAVLYEEKLPLRQLMKLEVGDTLTLELRPNAVVTVRCGDVTLTEGRMGRVGDRVAVRVSKPLRRPRTTFAMFEKADGSTKRMEAP
jgi:flagellar basal body-associated protein FliL